jgi:hypothetical protein
MKKTRMPPPPPAIDLMTIPNGTPLKACCGAYYPDRQGRVYGHYRNRWGNYIRVKMDDGTFSVCNSINTGPGIGWHFLTEAEKGWRNNG